MKKEEEEEEGGKGVSNLEKRRFCESHEIHLSILTQGGTCLSVHRGIS